MITIFYVITGYMYTYKKEILLKLFIKKRFKHLMIPYFWLSLLIIMFDFF